MKQKEEELKLLVEQTLGIELKTPSNFELLIGQIYQKTGQRLICTYSPDATGLSDN